MIYRKRIRKSGYSISLLPLHVKLELGRRVWYFNFYPCGKKWSSAMQKIKDVCGVETVTHTRKRDRVTVDRTLVQTQDYYGHA
jgi:hypothetical protein